MGGEYIIYILKERKLNKMTQHLYAVLLGGKLRENHLMEDHHLVFVVAESEKSARVLAKKKWQAEEVHIDGTQRIEQVDGYEIILEKSAGDESRLSTNPNYSL